MNKIKSLDIEEFTVFKKNHIEFSPGLNILIGKNGTGKTHLLKILYSFIKSKNTRQNDDIGNNVFTNLVSCFNCSLGDFVPKYNEDSFALLEVHFVNGQYIALRKNLTARETKPAIKIIDRELPICLYIPPQEMLSLFDGFIASWEKRENSFDQTYYDLAKALSLSPLKDTSFFNDLISPLENVIKGKVVKEGGRFYLEYDWGKVEAHLVAEGLRKLSQLIYLIANGSINENTVLLWDEPEVHFNPSLIEAIVVLLKGLVDKGLQIFITTHDYLLSQRLSLISEYENPDFPIRFFCLENEVVDGIKIEEGKTLAEIRSNPILDEFAQYYDFERAAFNKSSKV